MASPPATATATATETTPAVRFPPARVLLPFFVLLGYVALLISGFGTALGVLQPLPIYIYLSILLIFLQTAISENRSLARILYIFAASAFALIYAGEVVFDPSTGNFTRSPYTYIILNALLLAVFVYDTVDRRRPHRRGLDATIPAGARAQPGRLSPLSYGALGTDFAGMAILFFVAAFLLDLLGPQAVLRFLGVQTNMPYVTVDLNQALGLHLPRTLSSLQALDVVIAFGATAASLLFLGLVGVVAVAQPQPAGTPEGQTPGSSAVRRFGGSLQGILQTALNEVLLSLRLVLGPLVWLIPAFSIGNLATQVVVYLNLSSSAKDSTILDLFNPLSKTSRANFGMGIATVALGVVAVAAVILAVAVVEHDGRILRRTLAIVRLIGRTLAVTLAFFLYSLAALNAVAVLLLDSHAEPFQVGAPGLLALVAFAGFVFYSAVDEHFTSQLKSSA